MFPSDDTATPVLAEVDAQISQDSAGIQSRAATATGWMGPHSPFVGSTSSGTAALCAYPPSGGSSRLWAIWSSEQVDNNGTKGLTSASAWSTFGLLNFDTNVPVMDSQGNRIQSAFTPALVVIGNRMNLIVVKPDGRGTLAHYVYNDDHKWEYNSGWVTQPQTTASPSAVKFTPWSTVDVLYLAFTFNGVVNICTYTPRPSSSSSGPKYGSWSAPVITAIRSAQAPAIFIAPTQNGAELHIAAAGPGGLIHEFTKGSDNSQWPMTTMQPGGTTDHGVGACSTSTEAILTAPGAGTPPTLNYTIWTMDGATWPGQWTDAPFLTLSYGNAAPVVFVEALYCFYVTITASGYNLSYVMKPLTSK